MDPWKEEKAAGGVLHPDVMAVIDVAEEDSLRPSAWCSSDDDDDDDDCPHLPSSRHDVDGRNANRNRMVAPPSMPDAAFGHELHHGSNWHGISSAAQGRSGDGHGDHPSASPVEVATRRPAKSSPFATASSVRTVEAVPLVVTSDRLQGAPMALRQQCDTTDPPVALAVPLPEDSERDALQRAAVPDNKNPSRRLSSAALPPPPAGGLRPTAALDEAQVARLRDLGYSDGLIQGLTELRDHFPLRFWLLDNSGSMLTSDGCELRGYENAKASPLVVECTRWAELASSAAYHASLAGLLENHTVFRLLNDPEQLGYPQEFVVADPHKDSSRSSEGPTESAANALDILSKIEPRGFTPLTLHLNSIHESLKNIEGTLRQNGQRCVVLIATDGVPTDRHGDADEESKEAFRKSLKALLQLPVWVVFRLCTDDAEVVDYYNSLDRELEYSVEVIDDYFHEAKQVAETNPWLNYTMVLHRCREMGFKPRVFDLLDERLLNKDELMQFLRLIFGERVFLHAPDVRGEWKKFSKFLQGVMQLEKEHYNPILQKKTHWIDIRQLNKCYSTRHSFSKFFGFKTG